MPLKNLFNLTNYTLVVALALSAVAAYYSIIGLTAIFAGAMIPVIIMGSILEIGKITTTVWLRKYWNKCGLLLKLYLVPAVFAIAVLTSMGIFGFLSKAHMDTGLVSGDVQAKLALIDEKIKTQRDNIELARKALTQMDNQVDARLSRGDSENSAERAVQIRRQQAPERAKLQKEIGEAQKVISQLNEERAPIAAENRKVEAEVGPIKYVAALIYGDDPDNNLLERAVRWVIILLVVVFDPLAIALVLAANSSRDWDKELASTSITITPKEEPQSQIEEIKTEETKDEKVEAPWPTEWKDVEQKEDVKAEKVIETIDTNTPEVKPAYLDKGFQYPENYEHVKPLVYMPDTTQVTETVSTDEKIEKSVETKLSIIQALHDNKTEEVKIVTEGITKELPYEELDDNYVKYEGAMLQKDALKRLKPELFAVADNVNTIKTNFGTSFPSVSKRGDIFVRVDILPNRVFKFDGHKWIEMNKDNSTSYLDNVDYVQFLINKVYNGEYDIETLTDDEKLQIEEFLKSQKS